MLYEVKNTSSDPTATTRLGDYISTPEWSSLILEHEVPLNRIDGGPSVFVPKSNWEKMLASGTLIPIRRN